jgi:hypothetical protein
VIAAFLGLGASVAQADECGSKVNCNTGDGGGVTAGESSGPKQSTTAEPVTSGDVGTKQRRLDCGPQVAPQIRTASDVGDCFEPLQACPLAAGEKADPNFHVFLVTTVFPDKTTTRQVECNVDVRGAQPQPTPADVEKWLRRQIPVGSIGTPNAKSLVNLKTLFWLDMQPTHEWGPLTLLQANVRIRVTLDHVHWEFGDGVTEDAADAGKPYDPSSSCDAQCGDHYGHAYTTRKGAMKVDARSFWTAEFSVNGGGYVALPNPVAANPAPSVQVTIVEARSQLVGGPGS